MKVRTVLGSKDGSIWWLRCTKKGCRSRTGRAVYGDAVAGVSGDNFTMEMPITVQCWHCGSEMKRVRWEATIQRNA